MKLHLINSSLDDLVPLSLVKAIRPPPHYRAYRVLTPVLSDLGIESGRIVVMRVLQGGERIADFAVVAVHLRGQLLLRQFVPPRLLITNSINAIIMPIPLAVNIEIFATLPGFPPTTGRWRIHPIQ